MNATEPTARNGEGEFVLPSNSPIYVDSMNRGDGHTPAGRNSRWANLQLAAGVFFAVLAVYVLANPGRIDIIDGQVRYEVALNWVTSGRPVLCDRTVVHTSGVVGKHGFIYSNCGLAASVAAMPLVWVGVFYDVPPGEATRFLFCFTSSLLGALAAAILYLFYVELGVAVKEALVWTGVAAFATMMWPTSDTTFDNAQHACLVLIALFLGYMSGKRRSPCFAVLGGVVAGLLLTYQEYFALLIPLLAVSTLDWDSWGNVGRTGGTQAFSRPLRMLLKFDLPGAIREFKRPSGFSPEGVEAFHRACRRFALYLLATLVGVAVMFDYNYYRFGSVFESGKLHPEAHRGYPLFGNPLAGLVTLLVSPGKSILFYSPPILLGFAGIRRLWRHKPQIGFVVVAASVVLVLFISTISFVGGDWCWGPRYLISLVPLWALALPFVNGRKGRRRNLVAAIVGLGLVIQCLAVSVDNERFFFERGLADYFWAKDPWFYFKHSALTARVGETLSLIKGPPPSAVLFNTDNDLPTYTVLPPPPKGISRTRTSYWMRNYLVFYVPKPWPLWIWDIPADQRGINPQALLAGIFGIALLGLALLRDGLQKLPAESRAGEIAAEGKAAFLGPC